MRQLQARVKKSREVERLPCYLIEAIRDLAQGTASSPCIAKVVSQLDEAKSAGVARLPVGHRCACGGPCSASMSRSFQFAG